MHVTPEKPALQPFHVAKSNFAMLRNTHVACTARCASLAQRENPHSAAQTKREDWSKTMERTLTWSAQFSICSPGKKQNTQQHWLIQQSDGPPRYSRLRCQEVDLAKKECDTLRSPATDAGWNDHAPSNQRSQVAKWRHTLGQSMLHARTDILHAGSRLGRQGATSKSSASGTR